jgi:hypothetical protein
MALPSLFVMVTPKSGWRFSISGGCARASGVTPGFPVVASIQTRS